MPSTRLRIAEAAGQHGKFWPMHDLLFEHQDALEDEQLVAYAATLGIDPKLVRLGSDRRPVSAPRARGLCERGAQRRQRHATFFINGVRYEGGTDALLETLLEATIDAPH